VPKSKEIKKSFNPEIVFFGGVEDMITGSCYRVNSRDSAICVDYGMFQGRYEERSPRGGRRNFTPPGTMVRGVQDVLITHAHIDHTGRLPMVFRAGFTPTVFATEETAIFMEPLLYNSADIQAKQHPENRLYARADVDETLKHLKVVEPFDEFPVGQRRSNLTAELLPNGHVMGASSIFVRVERQNVLFTGDMGKPHQSLCGGYLYQVAQYPHDPVHVLVVESTSSNREPVTFSEKRTAFLNAIQDAWKNKGNPVLPTLSFHRFQEIIEMLTNSQHEGLIPPDCRIFIDAPLGMTLLDIFKELRPDQLTRRYGDDPNYYKTDAQSLARFDLKNVTVINSHEDSVRHASATAIYSGKSITIASGGMGEYGRVANYLQGDFASNPNNVVVFTCYQVAGTRGNSMLHGESIPGSESKRKAKVVQINGFTSHISGPSETFDFLDRFNLGSLETVIITHGNAQARSAMAQEFKSRGYGNNIVLPSLDQRIQI